MRQSHSLKETLFDLATKSTMNKQFHAINDVSLEIQAGTTLGLIGHNGSGKSTLLKLLGGILHPNKGNIVSRGRIAALIELGAGFHPDLTGRENIFLNSALLGLSKRQTLDKLEEIIEYSGVSDFIDTPVKFYSSGMYVRLAFSVAINVDPDILLVDEVLAVGDEPFQQKCLGTIKSFQTEGRTIVFVSHSAAQITDLCNEAVLLDHGTVMFQGDASEAVVMMRKGYKALVNELGLRNNSVLSKPIIGDVRANYSRKNSPTLDIHIEIENQEVSPNLVLGLALESSAGYRVYEINSSALGFDIPSHAGKHQLHFSLENLLLGAGNYSVTVGLGDQEGSTFDRQEMADSFEVSKFGNGNGLLAAHTRLEVVS
jgi:ABC-2 type transport system ATP-binding protein